MIISGLAPVCDPVCPIGATISDRTLAPKLIKKEKKIHRAKEASAEVAVLRKITENRIDTPSQKEI
jgi:hypothetical protein